MKNIIWSCLMMKMVHVLLQLLSFESISFSSSLLKKKSFGVWKRNKLGVYYREEAERNVVHFIVFLHKHQLHCFQNAAPARWPLGLSHVRSALFDFHLKLCGDTHQIRHQTKLKGQYDNNSIKNEKAAAAQGKKHQKCNKRPFLITF